MTTLHLKNKSTGTFLCGARSGQWGLGAQPTCPKCKKLLTELVRDGQDARTVRHEGAVSL